MRTMLTNSVATVLCALAVQACGGAGGPSRDSDEAVGVGTWSVEGDLACKALAGFVLLTPEPAGTCSVEQKVVGPTYVGNPDPYGNPACFQVIVLGTDWGTGFAGVTVEPMQFGTAETPAVLQEWSSTPGSLLTRELVTARAFLQLAGGTIQTRDVIVIDPTEANAAVEQLVVTGGTGRYDGASGTLTILGDAIGKAAEIKGKVCLPQPS